MSSDILKPVYDRPDVSVWIWQYYYYFMEPMIPMSFIGARGGTWRSLINFNGSLSDMLKFYNGRRYYDSVTLQLSSSLILRLRVLIF